MYKLSIVTGVVLVVLSGLGVSAQPGKPKSLDKVAAVVGSSVILQSDIEQQYAQYVMKGGKEDGQIRGYILQQLLTQKTLAQQAVIDSITVTDEDVDDQINRRMRYLTNYVGGPDKIEAFLNRPVLQYQDEIRPDVREQLVAEKMQRKITEKVGITPSEVKRFFEAIPKDSLPTYNAEVEIGQIVMYPKLTKAEKDVFRDKLEMYRLRIKNEGADFGALASAYSQDPGSAANGGEMDFMERSSFVKEFAAMAFRLKPGELSPVFETEYGFHIMQVMERKGELVKVRHILIKTEPTAASLARTKGTLDSIYHDVLAKRVPFNTAASLKSDDEETKYNGGVLLNSEGQSRTTYIPTDKLDVSIFSAVDTMKVGSYSTPSIFTGADGKTGYRFFYLKSKTNPHRANLEQDFPKIRDVAMEDKTNRIVSEWFEKRRKTTYIKIDSDYLEYQALKVWTKELSK